MALAFQILGPVTLRRDDQPVAISSRKQRTLLVALLLDANRMVSLDQLYDLLWEHDPPRSAVANLRTYAGAVRRLVQPADEALSRLISHGEGYQLRVEPGELDLDEFTERATRGQAALTRGDLPTARAQLADALSMWRGAPAEGAVRSVTLTPILDALSERRAATAEALFDARLGLGEHHEIVAELRRLAGTYPLRERLWAQLMTALYRIGDPAAALAAYATCRDTLIEQLGLEPGPELRRLQRAVLDRAPEPGLDRSAQRPVVTSRRGPAVPQQLPPDVDAFVGRVPELARLLDAPPGSRIDVSGPCGVGKSALVGHAAHRLGRAHPDGQLYADLAAPDMLTGEIAPRFLRALDPDAAQRCAGSPDEAAAQLRSVLAERRVLLVVESVTDPAQVRPLLPAAGRSTVLLTSWTPLTTLDGVRALDLDTLPVEDAVGLLGALAGPERIAAEPAAATELASLCDCLPMALRVAGARLAARPGRPVGWLARRLRTARTRLDELIHDDLSVRRCYARLARRAALLDTPAGQTFVLIGHLAGEAVTTSAVAGRLGVARADAEAALDRLSQLRLIDPHGPQAYRMRPLVRAFARDVAQARPLLIA